MNPRSVDSSASSAETHAALPKVAARRGPSAWSRREVLKLRRSKPGPDGRWRVNIDAERCSDCGACVRICKPRALGRTESDVCVTYALNPTTCDGCGDCTRACAEQALELFRAEQAVDHAEAVRLQIECCSRCDQLTAGLVKGICALCRYNDVRLKKRGDLK